MIDNPMATRERSGSDPLRVVVAGCGRWGSLIAWYLQRIGHGVTLYGRAESIRMQQLMNTHKNEYLELPKEVALSTDLTCVMDAQVVVLAIPSQSLRAFAKDLHALSLKHKTVVLCMKGLEVGTGERLSVVAKQELDPSNKIAVWLGPGHVQEFYAGIPNCMVIDSEDHLVKTQLVKAFSSELIRFYYGQDLIGNEIGAAAKNVIGIAAGMLDGLGLTTLKGALMSRGTREIARLIGCMGGNELSAYGLCHLGDYEATVFSEHSQNRAFGEHWVRKQPYDHLAEGYYTVNALMKMSDSFKVDLPICRAVYDVLYLSQDSQIVLKNLFRRTLKREF